MKKHPLIKFITSLRLTVTTLALAAVVVFLGTVAQEPMGLKLAVDRFFKVFFVDHIAMKAALDKCAQMFLGWQPDPIPQERLMSIGMPVFPGGYLLGSILLTGLFASYYARYVFSWKKAGIILTHLGVIILLVGQVLTDQLAIESYLHLGVGDRKNYTVSFDENELAVISPLGGSSNRVVSIPDGRLKPGAVVRHSALGKRRLKVIRYWPNARIVKDLPGTLGSYTDSFKPGTAQQRRARKQGDQFKYFLQLANTPDTKEDWLKLADRLARMDQALPQLDRQMKEDIVWFARGFADYIRPAVKHSATHGLLADRNQWVIPHDMDFGMSGRNFAAGIVEWYEGKNTEPAGRWLVSSIPFEYSDGTPSGAIGQSLDKENQSAPEMVLRNKRYYHDYTVTLLDTRNDVYPGTGIPKNFRSTVEVHSLRGEPFEAQVYMNHPLRTDGKTHYQHEMGQVAAGGGSTYTQLQVVENPGWLTPYLGCIVVAAGMLWQFLTHLIGFIRKRKTA